MPTILVQLLEQSQLYSEDLKEPLHFMTEVKKECDTTTFAK